MQSDNSARPVAPAVSTTSSLRTRQYMQLPTPIYCWQYDGEDFVLCDFNDAANDLTYGYISGLLGQPARLIYHRHPQAHRDLERCLQQHTVIIRRQNLWHPGLPVALPGVARFVFAPPDLVIVQVDLDCSQDPDE